MKTTATTSPPLVRDLMRIGVPTCTAGTLLPEAVRRLLAEGLEALVVMDEHGHALGLFGRTEAMVAFGLAGARSRPAESLAVAEALRPDIPEIPPDIPAAAAAQLMLDAHQRELYLLHHDGGLRWPAAVLRFEDVLTYLSEQTG